MNSANFALSLVAFSCFIAASQASAQNAPVMTPPGYSLKWSDEFEGSALDVNKWDYRTDSKHWSVQKRENVAVSNGTLKLLLKKQEASDKSYTGAGIISKRAFQYGYYQARLKMPPGAGWHTSFWMQKQDGSGGTSPKLAFQELDVVENDSNQLRAYGVNVHKWKGKHLTLGSKTIKTPDLSADFHVFGCEFTPTTIKYFFDGALVQSVDATQIRQKDGTLVAFEHGEQNIWITAIASHLNRTKAVDDAQLPAVAECDYVRFFEKSANPVSTP